MSKALPLTKVVQNDVYTAPALPSSVRTKALTSMSRTLVNKEEPPKELPPSEVRGELRVSPLTVCRVHLREVGRPCHLPLYKRASQDPAAPALQMLAGEWGAQSCRQTSFVW